MTASQQIAHPAGSHWRRWAPHLHAPGRSSTTNSRAIGRATSLRLKRRRRPSSVLGVTDYFSIGCYRAVKRRWQNGRLSGVKLLFPNVEMRLDLATDKKRSINLHLLFSPEDVDHEDHVERVLAELSFEYKGRNYHCTSADLQALGALTTRPSRTASPP